MKIIWLAAHYFLWFGSLSGVLPYVVLFGETHAHQIVTNIGIMLIAFRFCTLLAKPFFCFIADKYNSHKTVLIISALCTYTGHTGLLLLPYAWSGLKWPLFCLLVLLAHCGTGCVISLTDSIAMKEVTRAKVDYGKVRVLGAIGWGTFSIVNGLLNRYVKVLPSYFSGIIVAGILKTLDLILLYYTVEGKAGSSGTTSGQPEVTRRPESVNLTRGDEEDEDEPEVCLCSGLCFSEHIPQTQSVLQEVVYAFRKYPSLVRYILLAVVIGVLQSFHWSYFYYFIKSISEDNTQLMGLATGVECFLGEVPLFLIANDIVKKFGPSISMMISLAAFVVRYLLYAYCITSETQYWVLLVELLQGPAFGLFYCVITAVAQDFSVRAARELSRDEKGQSEVAGRKFSTLQGILSSAFEGAGLGLGSLFGGVIIDQWMVTGVWLVGAAIAFITFLIECTVSVTIRCRSA